MPSLTRKYSLAGATALLLGCSLSGCYYYPGYGGGHRGGDGYSSGEHPQGDHRGGDGYSGGEHQNGGGQYQRQGGGD